MSTWRRIAVSLFPEYTKGHWGFQQPHMTIYRIFFELEGDIDRFIQTNDEDSLARVFQLVEWCFDQRRQNRDIWNAAATAFLEHLADTDERAAIIPHWVKPPLFEAMRGEFEKRRERNGVGKFQELLTKYNRANHTSYT